MFSELIIVGNVGKDPEMRFTPSGQPVTSFSVATNRKYHTKEEEVQETTWYRIAVWGKMAEIVNEYVKRGMLVMVIGTLTPDRDTGGPKVFKKSDGTYGATFEVNARTVRFLSKKERLEQTDSETPFDPESDIPF